MLTLRGATVAASVHADKIQLTVYKAPRVGQGVKIWMPVAVQSFGTNQCCQSFKMETSAILWQVGARATDTAMSLAPEAASVLEG